MSSHHDPSEHDDRDEDLETIQLSHGSGGTMMHRLIREYFVPAFDIKTLSDSAVVDIPAKQKLAITTDSYVVSPLFFPGGDIGTLAICGTVNDLAVSGARPLYLTAGFIIEEGFPVSDLERILNSMKSLADKTGVAVVAGDTKVVDKGKADGVFINTAGIGVVYEGVTISSSEMKPGDKIILSGSIGNHGISVMAERNGISFEPQIMSDVRPLNNLVETILRTSKNIRTMRDPTRGGLATTLKEMANDSGYGVTLFENAVRIQSGVRGACELLGLDPLYVANEGILVAVVANGDADKLIYEMKKHTFGRDSAIIGEVSEKPEKTVLLKTDFGGTRIIDMLSGDQLPRIC
ncbi:MAG: hydrogenase expression/formation protein HypE [Nitrospiraceae bacterium]|nr:MAG: hydrogenase expression/formation protein HypE [Nitrospiraceae bacterium]